MTDTIPHITLTDQWQSVYALTGIDVGAALSVENIGNETAELHIAANKPNERSANVGASSLYPLATKYTDIGISGLWARNKADTKGTRLQISEAGGITNNAPDRIITFPSLFLKFEEFTQPSNSASYALVRNRTNASLIIEQLMNFESFSQGLQDGTSILTLSIFFNVDITGATIGTSIGKAYVNNSAGDFEDRTNNGVDIFDLDGFDEGLNPDFLRIGGGSVSYFSSQQSTAVAIANESLTLARPIIIPPAGNFVVRYKNDGVINNGTDTTTTSLFSGRFINDPILVLPPSTADFDDDYTNDFA